jgi:hypothetical protein
VHTIIEAVRFAPEVEHTIIEVGCFAVEAGYRRSYFYPNRSKTHAVGFCGMSFILDVSIGSRV